MDHDLLEQYRTWFAAFVQDHSSAAGRDQQNILLKEEHTHRVCDNARGIAAGLHLDARSAALAEAVALFHDVGRFPQYRQYGTFQDSRSVNHAALGARVLVGHDVLRDLPRRERVLVVRAVTLHNVFTLPAGLDEEALLLTRLVRDADKLDIWRVFTGLLGMDKAHWPSAADLGLPDAPGYSPEVLASLLERREMVLLASLRSLNDFKLLQLAWIYDLNFAPSLRMVRERDIIGRLAATLPQDPQVRRAVDELRQYVDGRLAGPSWPAAKGLFPA